MSTAAQCLYALAAEQFPDLTDAERALLLAIAAGETARYGGQTEAESDPKYADAWGELRTIRAEVIRWLCIDREAIRHIDPRGIYIYGANIDGELDLRAVTILFPLFLERCVIRQRVRLNFAETRLLSFAGSISGPIDGEGLTVQGALWLRQGFRAEGTVSLFGATISGHLDCTRGTFLNASGVALHANTITVHGPVILRRGFHAEGAVELIGATIAGDLDCGGGPFITPARPP